MFMYRTRIPRSITGYEKLVFKDCVLLKDAVDGDDEIGTHRRTKIDIICVYSNGRMEFEGVENETDFFISKESSIKNINDSDVTFVFDIFKYIVNETYEDVLESIEDFYGGVYTDTDKVIIGWFFNTCANCNLYASKIAKQFRESISNPSYTLCKNRLLREFNDLYF